MRSWLVVVALTGCIEHELVRCGDQFCPVGTECVPTGCATSDQVTACAGKSDGDECDSPVNAQGHCLQGTCLDSICGDGIVEFGEACDDRNLVGLDGCSDRCDSNETCGNSVVDLALGEQCDQGVPYLGGDGCSSRCTIEIDVWRDVTPRGIPSRYSHVMVYDPDRQVLLVFGGTSQTGILGDTWTYANGNWTRHAVTGPSARRDAIMVYDPIRQEAILFGGHDGSGALSDTWSWDGATWTPEAPTTVPPAREKAAATYDSQGQELVMFGGSNAGVMLGDTWTWNGTNWTLEAPVDEPAPRRRHAMAYDASRNRAVLYGGTNGTTEFSQTWEWTGANWISRTVAAMDRPTVQRGMTLTYDQMRGKVILFGGEELSNARSGTWRWDPANDKWTSLDPGQHPSARKDAASAYLPSTGIVVMGGRDENGTPEGDAFGFTPPPGNTWNVVSAATIPTFYQPAMTYDPATASTIGWDSVDRAFYRWNGQVWTRARLPVGALLPGPRIGGGFTWDEARGVAVMFGGYAGPYFDDTWIYDGTELREVTPATTPPAGVNRLVYDSIRRVVVMLLVPAATQTLETWIWDGADWTQVPGTSPPRRSAGELAFDRARGRVVLFGGTVNGTWLADTWEWDGSTWTQATPTGSPSGRGSHVMVYDPARQRTVLFGGENPSDLGDTWEWDGVVWAKRPDLTAPPARALAGATYDRARRKLVITAGNGGFYEDTWTYGFESFDSSAESCILATDDLDADGRAGCNDPDCWGRCTPFCVPGEPCSEDVPSCGDGLCSAFEDVLLCPQDNCPPP